MSYQELAEQCAIYAQSIMNLSAEVKTSTEIGYRWMGKYSDKKKECAELRLQLDNVTRQLDSLYKAAGERP